MNKLLAVVAVLLWAGGRRADGGEREAYNFQQQVTTLSEGTVKARLKGIQELYVIGVFCFFSDTLDSTLNHMVKDETMARLEDFGLNIQDGWPPDKWRNHPGKAALIIMMDSSQPNAYFPTICAYRISVRLVQIATLLSPPGRAENITVYDDDHFDTVAIRDLERVSRDHLTRMVDRFARLYLSANPITPQR